jgi:hypothetical protein
VLDNTPPVVVFVGLPAILPAGTDVEIIVEDDHPLELDIDGAGVAVHFDAPPYRFTWAGQCGDADVSIRTVDAAGWESTWAGSVYTTYVADEDCDGYRSIEIAGGDDCDDANAGIHPGQDDLGPLGDVNCDGAAGIDADGDGIPSVASGGRDCDDADPAIHPYGTTYERTRLVDGIGATLEWAYATASVAVTNEGVAVAINRDRTVELVTDRTSGDVRIETVATGVEPGRVALLPDGADLSIFYSTGKTVGARLRRDGQWMGESALHAIGILRQPKAANGLLGGARAIAVAATDDSSVYLAIRTEEAGWTEQRVDTPISGEPSSIIEVGFDADDVVLTYLAGSSVYRTRSNGSDPASITNLGEVPAWYDPDPACYDRTFERLYYLDSNGCLVHSGDPTPLSPCFGAQAVRLFCAGNQLYLQPTQGALGHFDPFGPSFEYLPMAVDIMVGGTLDSFARSGSLFRSREIGSAEDPIDGVDRDCDGED